MSERYDPELRINELEDKLAATEVQRDEFDACNRSNSSQLECVRQQLRETEVQRDAALAACRNHTCDYEGEIHPERVMFTAREIYEQCKAALAMTPERVAGVIEERDQYKKALEVIGDEMNWGMSRGAFLRSARGYTDPCVFARQALAPPKGETT